MYVFVDVSVSWNHGFDVRFCKLTAFWTARFKVWCPPTNNWCLWWWFCLIRRVKSLMAQSAILWWCSAVSPEKRRTGKFSLCQVKKKKQQQKQTLAVSANPARIADIVLSRPLKLPYLIQEISPGSHLTWAFCAFSRWGIIWLLLLFNLCLFYAFSRLPLWLYHHFGKQLTWQYCWNGLKSAVISELLLSTGPIQTEPGKVW